MEIEDEYAIKYEKYTGNKPYYKGYYHKDFVREICKQHREMKEALAQVKTETPQETIDAKLYEVNMAAMLGELKKELLEVKSIKVNL